MEAVEYDLEDKMAQLGLKNFHFPVYTRVLYIET